jgi:hypothetical protein
MSLMPKCTVVGCDSPVSKSGYTLCYKHWLAESKSKKSEVEVKAKAKEDAEPKTSGFLTSTQLGERLNLSSRKLNQVFSELGWIERAIKGWVPTEQGCKLHAKSLEHHQTGVPYVLWPEAITTSRILIAAINELIGVKSEAGADKLEVAIAGKVEKSLGFRDKFPPTHRAADGHWVRSRAETLIDNWLYTSSVIHAYERLLPVEEELYCDFYIPKGRVYIEYWGLENDPKYMARKAAKKEIYLKYGFNLIELNDEHIQNLDDYLPKMLLKFNVAIE